MLNKSLFSSASCEWETPQDIFNYYSNIHGPFDIDVCATPENTKCTKFYTTEDDGLVQTWSGNVWCNPPYGRQIGRWVEKAYNETCVWGTSVTMLIPARTDTKWWHQYIQGIAYVTFIKGRLKFSNSKNSAPFPSAIIHWK